MAEIPLDDDEDFETSAMAAAMGFSSFGAPASKKRKFNPRADAAFVASSSSSSAAPAPAPSGANTTTLGARQPRVPPTPSEVLPLHASAGLPARPSRDAASQQNSDEIALDDDADEGGDDDDDPEPQYIDTSRPARRLSSAEREAREAQEQIDAIVAARVDEAMAQALSGGGSALPVLPPPPGLAAARGGGHDQRHPPRHGGRAPGHVWWEDYHDPSFNQNPWEWLEKTRGLVPRGTWVPRAARSG